jgi:hypothetical protein
LTVRENDFVAVPPPDAWTVKLELSTVVGVPLRIPAVDKVSPAGRVPDVTDQLYGDVPPLAANVWLYADPTVPEGRGLAVSITGPDELSSPPPHPTNNITTITQASLLMELSSPSRILDRIPPRRAPSTCRSYRMGAILLFIRHR